MDNKLFTTNNVLNTGGGGGYCGFLVTGMIKIWEQEKQKPKTILRASNKSPIKPGPLI